MRHLLVAMVVVLMAIVGCKSSKKVDTATEVAVTQEQFAKIEPGTKLGAVDAVLPEAHLLAVTGLGDLAIGDTLVIMTPEKKLIGAGHVVEKTADAVHVSYDVNEKGRSPRVGDLAVKPAR